MSFVLDTPEGIAYARLAALKGRLKIEIAGMRFKGRSTSVIVSEMAGKRMNKAAALEWVQAQMEEALREQAQGNTGQDA